MRFTNLTRANEIGANCYLLEAAGRNVVLDCGLHPRFEGDAATPNFSLLPADLHAAVVTHAHLDHAGALPMLRRLRPEARVFMTAPTAALNDALLHNSVNVMTRRADDPAQHAPPPLFTHREADHSARVWQEVPLDRPWSFEGERLASTDEESACFRLASAGHILGSAAVEIFAEGKRIVYTGDINLEDQTVSRAARLPEEPEPDALIIETTRGDYQRPESFTRAGEEARFGAMLREGLARGAVLVPVFALGKTQEVLAMILRFKQEGILREDTPLFIGGLSARMSEIHDRFASAGEFPRKFADLMARTGAQKLFGADIAQTPARKGTIYALSSGMMTEATLSHTFALKLLRDPKHSIFFVGYADPESPAGHLRRSQPGEKVPLGEQTPPQERKCAVNSFDFSAHATREAIRAYVSRVRPKKVFLVHGDAPALAWFAGALETDLPGTEVIIPKPGQGYEV